MEIEGDTFRNGLVWTQEVLVTDNMWMEEEGFKKTLPPIFSPEIKEDWLV